MSPAPTSPLNYQITVNQHVFPSSGLKRFAASDHKLRVLDLGTSTVKRFGPDAAPFVVNRLWDQRTENRTMCDIETRFALEAGQILRKKRTSYSRASDRVISEMLCLWRVRVHRAHNPLPDVQIAEPKRDIAGPVIERGVAREAVDRREQFGIITPDENGTILGRLMAGPLIQLEMDRELDAMHKVRWGIVWARSGEGEFDLPDNFGRYLILPLSPTCCLVGEGDHGTIGRDGISQINGIAQACSAKYIAARDFVDCPGIVLPVRQLDVKQRGPSSGPPRADSHR